MTTYEKQTTYITVIEGLPTITVADHERRQRIYKARLEAAAQEAQSGFYWKRNGGTKRSVTHYVPSR